MSDDIGRLVERAISGDEAAWRALVDRYDGLLWWTVRRFRLGDEAAADVVQTTWATLVTKISEVQDPEKLSGWLLTTTRRRCIDMVNATAREKPLLPDESEPCPEEGPEEYALRTEREAIVRAALERLPHRQRTLLKLLSTTPPTSYQEIGLKMDMAIGSIGAARARALRRLRTELEAHDIAAVS